MEYIGKVSPVWQWFWFENCFASMATILHPTVTWIKQSQPVRTWVLWTSFHNTFLTPFWHVFVYPTTSQLLSPLTQYGSLTSVQQPVTDSYCKCILTPSGHQVVLQKATPCDAVPLLRKKQWIRIRTFLPKFISVAQKSVCILLLLLCIQNQTKNALASKLMDRTLSHL